METNLYTPFILLGLFMFITMVVVFTMGERLRKKDEKETRSFLRHMHIENLQERKETRKILREIQQTNRELKQINKDNAVYLHRIFEIVDAPEDEG